MKQKLLYNPEYWTNLTTVFLEPIWDQYFERIAIAPEQHYDPNTHVIFANILTANNWIWSWIDKGFKVIVDNTWESHAFPKIQESKQIKYLHHYNWHRMLEPIWYESLGYNFYTSNPNINKTFLMLMNLKKPHRTAIYDILKPVLKDSIYSYIAAGIPLQNSTDIATTDDRWQRYINTEWYNTTAFSVVVETKVHVNETNHKPWLSEKIYKPIAFEHPFIAWAAPGSLDSLRAQGFKTFGHIIDESYDSIVDNKQRMLTLCDIVIGLTEKIKENPNYLRTTETMDILKHNRKLFYNQDYILQDFKTNIAYKIKEFCNE